MLARRDALLKRLGVRLPIIAAPMAGAAGVDIALAAGAVQEGETCDAPYGRLAMFADPFGHGFCLIQFNEVGYDAVKT